MKRVSQQRLAFVVLSVVVVAGLAALGWFTTSNACIPCHSRPVPNHASWMEDHLSTLGHRKLSQLVLPASHDAAMYRGGFLGWNRTQCLSIYEQLANGIRWFDLRPRWTGDKFVIHHGATAGPDFSEVLADVRSFAEANHRELILLKLSHFEGVDRTNYPKLAAEVTNALWPWLVKPPLHGKHLADMTLAEYTRNGPAILVLVDGHYALDHPVLGLWVYGDWDSAYVARADLRVFDIYSNTTDFDLMKTNQFQKFRDFTGKCTDGKTDCDLFLLSWTLTPPYRKWVGSQPAILSLEGTLQQHPMRNGHGKVMNLIYADFVEFAGATEVAIAGNERLGD